MLDWLQQHAIALGVVSAAPIAMWVAKKYIPQLAKKYSDIFLRAMCNPDVSDPYVKNEVIIITKSAMRIAAHTMAGATGTAKRDWVIQYLISKTSLKASDIKFIVDQTYEVMRQELNEHGAELAAEDRRHESGGRGG